jgi:hypothetical protein
VSEALRVFVTGMGQMGSSHALAHHRNSDCKIVDLNVDRLLHEGRPLDL